MEVMNMKNYKESLEKVNLEINKNAIHQSTLEFHSVEYRESLQKEIKLLNKKKRIIYAQIDSLKELDNE
jgi:hypothetical protein